MSMLQQYLPFTVLKQYSAKVFLYMYRLQQYLPFTVLKLVSFTNFTCRYLSCNSTYRLRYWNPNTIKDNWYITII